MKKINYCLLFLSYLILIQFAFSQKPANEQQTKRLKEDALKLYQQRKFDEALQLLRQIIQIKEKEVGFQHLEIAETLYDIAIVEIASGNEQDAEKTLNTAIAVYESKTNLNASENIFYAQLFEMSGYIKYKDKKYDKAIVLYQRALAMKEKHSGAESLETGKTLWRLANAYLTAGDDLKALNFYERVVKIRSNNLGKVSFDDAYDALKRYDCILNKTRKSDLRTDKLTADTEAKIKEYSKQTVVKEGIINGKAEKLVRPQYPKAAIPNRIRGSVEVSVTIDETGKIIFACAQSGNPIFYSVAEVAAINSKFAPTLTNGKPVKVSGVIVYNFDP